MEEDMGQTAECQLEIEFLSGPRDGDVLSIAGASAIIGRDQALDVPIPADTVVSRRHAQLRWVDGKIQIEDLDSSFGTFVNGEKIAGTQVLREHDVVGVGHTEFVCRPPRPHSAARDKKELAAEVDSRR